MPIPGMDRPPLPSPDIQSQMGTPQTPAPAAAGLGTVTGKAGGAGQAPGGPNPHGFLMAQVEAIKKVLDQAAAAEPTFAPFAQKATSILDSGVAAVSTAPTPGIGTAGQTVEPGTGGPPPNPPGGMGAGGPGGPTPPLG